MYRTDLSWCTNLVHLQPVPAVPEVVATAPVEIAFGSHKGYKTPLPVEEVAPVAIATPAPALPVKEAVYSVPGTTVKIHKLDQ